MINSKCDTMQIFVKHPSSGKTFVFSCIPETTLESLIGWVEDIMGWPPKAYYITRHGRPISYPYDQLKTFQQLGINTGDTIHLTGRLIPM